MKPYPFGTLSLLILAILVTAGVSIFDQSIYGVESHALGWLGFTPSAPWRYFGLSWILSGLMHQDFSHLITNLIILIPVAMIIERKLGSSSLVAISIFLHVMVLVSLILCHQFYSLENKSFLGTSHLAMGLYVFWGIHQKKWGLLILPAGVLIWGLWVNQGPQIMLAHLMGVGAGVLVVTLGQLWRKIRSQSSH
jgi:membrane associated rhomboid family serine protease